MSNITRSKQVTILGWIFISLGLINLISLAMIIVGIPFVIIGIGILKCKKSARLAGITYEWLQVFFSLIGIVGGVWLWISVLSYPDALNKGDAMYNLLGIGTMAFILGFINLIFSLGLIFWLNHPKVKEELIK